jgi:pimeloyl-ACP methyl ester carboxylesterase
MNTAENTLPSPRRALVAISTLLALVALPACGTRLDSTVAQIDGHAVELVETGAGDTTVVFESGLGDDWTPWDAVASQVATKARVFAYSRPGYGHSARSEAPRNAATIVEELRTLLAARGVAPPYLLVGHSFGGTYMELFAKAHPEEVVGLVLVETRHRDFGARCQQDGFDGCTIPDAALANLPPFQAAEFKAFARSSDEIRPWGAFGNYPVRVLTATTHDGFSPKVETLWKSLHAALAREAANGAQTVFARTGHYLQLERSEDVTQAILKLIPKSKAGALARAPEET